MNYCKTNVQDFMEMLKSTGKRIIAFGAGEGYKTELESMNHFISILCDNWRTPDYAVDEMGKEYALQFDNIEDYIDFFVDNDSCKTGNKITLGKCTFEINDIEALKRINCYDYVILITVINKHYQKEIIKQLNAIDNLSKIVCYSIANDMHYYEKKNRGFVIERMILPYLDFVKSREWMHIENTIEKYSGYHNKVYDEVKQRIERGECICHGVEIQVTTVCNLKCKYCLVCIPKLPKQHHVSVEQVLNDIDIFLDIVDDCPHIQLGSGEAVLYPWLDQVLEKLISNEKVKLITIITNGMKYPTDEKILRNLANPKVVIIMSNYHKPHITDITREFYKEHGVYVDFWEEQEYFRIMGQDICNRHESWEEMHAKLMNCGYGTLCPQVIYEGRMFVCGKTPRYIELCNTTFAHDFVDLKDFKNKEELKHAFTTLRMKSHLDSCGWCDAMDEAVLVPAGEQMEG